MEKSKNDRLFTGDLNGGPGWTWTTDLALIRAARFGFTTGSKITAPVLDWSAEDLVVRSDSRVLGVAGSFSQCAFALIVW